MSRRPSRLAVGVALATLTTYLLTHEQETRALLLGVGAGALVAAIALAVVLTYRGSGVVNFASGAVAMSAAYLYDGLQRDANWAPGPALTVALLASAALGLVFHLMVFRPLRGAPPLAKVVASVGLLMVLQAVVVLRFGGTSRPVKPILDKAPVHLPGSITIPSDQLVLAGIVIALAVALWALFRFTRFGLATRAAAENEKAATILGFSPDLLAGASWVLSTVVAGLLGVLVATVNGTIDPATITLLIVPALGAALVGNFTSFGITTLAGFGIAMTQNLIQFESTKSWFPSAGHGPLPGVKETLPFLVIVIALFARGRSLPVRGALEAGRLPVAPEPRGVVPKAAVGSAACVAGLLFLGPDWRIAITNSLIGMLICLSLVVLTGFVGQISLAQMTLAGVAGFTLSKLAGSHGVPFPISPLIGAVVAAGFGALAAIPALRVRGVNLAVVTLASAVAVENLVFKNPAWAGGFNGSPVPSPELAGLQFGPNDGQGLDGKLPNPWFGIFCLIVVVVLAAVVVNLRRSATGRQMLAVRSNERAAAAAGVSVAGTKLLAFAFAAFIAGLGGGLSGYRFGSVTPVFFGGLASLAFLAFAYLGGITSVTGAVIGGCLVGGGIAFTALDQWLGISDDYTLLIGGVGLVVTAVLNPEGIAGAGRAMGDRTVAWYRSRPAVAAKLHTAVA